MRGRGSKPDNSFAAQAEVARSGMEGLAAREQLAKV